MRVQAANIVLWWSKEIVNSVNRSTESDNQFLKSMMQSLSTFIFMSLLLIGGQALAEDDLLKEIGDLRLQGKLDDARRIAERELESGMQDHRIIVELHLELALIFDRIGLHTNTRPVAAALEHIEAAQLLVDVPDRACDAAVELALANYYYRAEMAGREFQIATKHARRAIDLFRQLADKSGQADAVHRLGLIKYQSGELQEARELFEESLTLDKAGANRVWFRGEYERHLGLVLQKSGDRVAAIPYFKRSLEARLEAGAIDASMFAALTLAESEFAYDDLEDATRNAEYAMTVSELISSPVGKAHATDLIGRIKERDEDTREERDAN